MLFFLTFYKPKNPEKKLSQFPQKYKVFSTLIIINVSWAADQHIRMISEDCDNEDWSDYIENSALHHKSKLHFKIN